MPEFLIKKLKSEYGQDSKIPYAVANARGYMSGPNETPKGAVLERKHKVDVRRKARAVLSGKKAS